MAQLENDISALNNQIKNTNAISRHHESSTMTNGVRLDPKIGQGEMFIAPALKEL